MKDIPACKELKSNDITIAILNVKVPHLSKLVLLRVSPIFFHS